MSVQTPAPRKKKTGRNILLVILALLLVAAVGVGAYVYSIGSAWNNNTQKIENSESPFPNEDGSIPTDQLDTFKKNMAEDGQANKDVTITNDSGKDLSSDIDKNGNGILDADEESSDGSQPKNHERPAETGATNILLMGSDSRAGTAESATVKGQRADSLMLLHVPEDGSNAYLISIMRDTWVNIPGYGPAKINAALDHGGVALQVSAIEQLLDTRIDHIAEVDFEGFMGMVDSMDGVTVNVPLSFEGDGYTYTAGPQKMDGEEALTFVRQRYQFSDGDYQRVRNQRAFIRGVFDTLKSRGVLNNATEFKNMVTTMAPYLTVDEGLDAGSIVSIASPMISNPNFGLKMMTLPNAGTGWSSDGQSIVVVDLNANQELSNALKNETMDNYVATHGAD